MPVPPGPGVEPSRVRTRLAPRRLRGALAAWVAFTLPSALLLVIFAIGALRLEGLVGQGLTLGLKAVAVAVVAHAVIGMARTLTPDLRRILIGLAAAGLTLLLPGSFGQIAAILIGLAAGVLWCCVTTVSRGEALAVRVSHKAGVTALVVFGCLLAGLPVLAALTQNTWAQIADAFTRAGALVLGGGHVVLPMLQTEAAIASAITPEQFLAGYGAAQAVPGPLFTFAAYLGFDMVPGALAPFAALLALIAVFVPGLLLLVAVLPFWDRVRQNPTVRAALGGANAAVVGILAAALWTPVITSGITGVTPLGIAAACFLLLTVWKLPAWVVVLAGALAGVAVAATGVILAWA